MELVCVLVYIFVNCMLLVFFLNENEMIRVACETAFVKMCFNSTIFD